MSKKKPYVNIGAIGHIDAGKTTITDAMENKIKKSNIDILFKKEPSKVKHTRVTKKIPTRFLSTKSKRFKFKNNFYY